MSIGASAGASVATAAPRTPYRVRYFENSTVVAFAAVLALPRRM